jgi:hypothetical protein
MTAHTLAAIVLFVTGCSNPVRLIRPRPCPPSPLEAERVSLELAIPHPDKLFIPPMPVPATMKRSRMVVRVVIDTSGRVMPDSITVCGVKDPMYMQRIATEVSAMRFRPGLMRAKHVIAPTLFTYEF